MELFGRLSEKHRNFTCEGTAVYTLVQQRIRAGESIRDFLELLPDAISIKDTDGRIELANVAFWHLYSQTGQPPEGNLQVADAFASIISISDSLIWAGCETVEFQHRADDGRQRILLLRSLIGSLLHCNHSRYAIFSLTRILHVVESDSQQLHEHLESQWQQFQTLGAGDQAVLVALARGQKPRDIASELGITEKTVNNRRKSAMRQLSINSQAQLIAMLVRLHDAHYGDFGF